MEHDNETAPETDAVVPAEEVVPEAEAIDPQPLETPASEGEAAA